MKVYLGDLGHYTIKLTNNHTPIGIGFIAAYLKKHFEDNVEIRLFKNPDLLIDAIESSPPEVLGLSNYIWCQSISEEVLQFYKKVRPDGITVWGGPNFPMNEPRKAKEYLLNKPYVEFYIPFEGEIPTVNIIRAVIDTTKSMRQLKSDHPEYFEGAYFISEGNELIGRNIGVQLRDINEIPSPYLQGLLDPFLAEGLHAMFETQRGCPYHCTFCHTGLTYYDRGRSFSLERLKSEIEYITKTVKNPTKTHLYITDTNFGMWPQDLEFAVWMRNHTEQTGFPLSFGTTTGKGRSKAVLETVLSHPKLTLSNSVQSLDDTVLKAIKRKNFPIDEMIQCQDELDKAGKLSKPEIILGLPCETRDSHLNTLRKLMKDVGANIIYQYTLMLLPGTEMYTDESREKYHYEVKYRLLPTSYGVYRGKKCFEIEEVSVGTKDLTFDDYLEMREVFFFVHNVYSNAVYRPLVRHILYLEDDIIEFLLYLMSKRRLLEKEGFANTVVEEYLRDTKDELFSSREELIQYYIEDGNYAKLLTGEKGKNMTHTYRAIILLRSREWADFVTRSYRDFIREKHGEDQEAIGAAESVTKHVVAQAECQFRYFSDRSRIPSQKAPLQAELDFDVPTIFARRINKLSHPVLPRERRRYSYFMKEDAIRYIASFQEKQRIVDLALVVLRMDQSYLFPVCSCEEKVFAGDDQQGNYSQTASTVQSWQT